MILKGYLFSVVYALVCLALAFALYKLGAPKKITRKIVHILIGFEWVILYHFHGPSPHFIAVCLMFLALLALSNRKKLMPMISSDGDNSPGTVYYAVAMTVMSSVTLLEPRMMLPFGIGVFCTSFGDGLAGLVGQSINARWNIKLYGNKSLVGGVVNLVSCFAVSLVFKLYFGLDLSYLHCVLIAVFALELELFVGRGFDNISVTLGTSFLAYFFINSDRAYNYIVPIILTPLIIAFAYKKRALTVGGIVAALAVDIIISLSLGNFGFCTLLLFFVGGIAVDKIKKYYKKPRQNTAQPIEKRGDCRDHVQVLANAIVASVCALVYLITGEKLFVVAFVASLAEAFADTAASGIGVLRGKAYDLFRLRPCTPGISGGMSLLGTAASLLAAAIVAALGLVFDKIDIVGALIVLLSAFLGAVFDSFLGSLVQIKYKCNVCGQIVEREEHCGEKTVRHAGIPFVTNDTVNLLGTLFSATLAPILYFLIT